jgi:hypothetical protein
MRIQPRLLLTLPLASLLACGSDTPAAPPTVTPPTTTTVPAAATLADLSASVESTEADNQVDCRDGLPVRVTLTNRARAIVLVTGVRRTTTVVSGDCEPGDPFTYSVNRGSVGPESAGVVLDRIIYSNGSGCCFDPTRCGGKCEFETRFDVHTAVGVVPAGGFRFRVKFSERCGACASSGSGARELCRAQPGP